MNEESVVVAFLDALASKDLDQAFSLIADDIVYTNVSLPAIKGRKLFERVMRAVNKSGGGFEYVNTNISSQNGVVLTQRIDALTQGPFRAQFWVWGQFTVVDGKIAIWSDYFDWWNITRANIRGLIGIFLPFLRAKMPAA